jgi:hypothetical protein
MVTYDSGSLDGRQGMITRANLSNGDERVMGCEAVNLRSPSRVVFSMQVLKPHVLA